MFKITYTSWIYKCLDFLSRCAASIKWQGLAALFNDGKYWHLTEADLDQIRKRLKDHYYIILTRRRCHLTTYLTAIANKIKTGKWGFYSHALMNIEDIIPTDDQGFTLVEATAPGTHTSTFMQVFDCDAVALLVPKGFTATDWTKALDAAVKNLGKPYDNLFNVLDDTHLSCVEYDRLVLESTPNYSERFARLEAMIKADGNQLTPQMLYDCPDFEIVWEVRR